MDDQSSGWVEFFKALADETRLKLVGLLARESLTGEQLAAMLGVRPATVSHHLARLAEAGLVAAEGHSGREKPYRLRVETVHALARGLLADGALPRAAAGVDVDAFDRRVVRDFSRRDGTLREIPAQQKKLQAVLRHIARQFQPGRDYSERQVNAVLAGFHPDIASLRRGLISYGLLAREADGGRYWLPAPAAAAGSADAARASKPPSRKPAAEDDGNQEALERFFTALVDTDRLAIAGQLSRGTATSAQLAEALGLKPAAVSRHLADLIAAGLVRAEARPAGARYELSWAGPRALAGQLAARRDD